MGEKCWVGIDVGGNRKGFDVAVVTKKSARYEGSFHSEEVERLASVIVDLEPVAVAIDSPQGWAAGGSASRGCERKFARLGVCGIRYTPDPAKGKDGDYYEWIRNGLKLWEAIGSGKAIEVFPTASWTCWAGKRGKSRRARWTTNALKRYDLTGELGLPRIFTNQDKRDAFAAAVTAKQWDEGDAMTVSCDSDPEGYSPVRGIVIPKPDNGLAPWPT